MNKLILAMLALALLGTLVGRSAPAHAILPIIYGDTTARKDSGPMATPFSKADYSLSEVNAIRAMRRGRKSQTPTPARTRTPQIVILNKGH